MRERTAGRPDPLADRGARRTVAQATRKELEQICRQHGLPFTAQRRVVLEVLWKREDHPTADEIFLDARARMPEISRTTVYRVLEKFVQIRVVRKVCHPGASARYERKMERHHHLVCLECEKMVDFEDPSMDGVRLPDARSGFHISDYSIQFWGLCRDCAAKLPNRRPRSRK